MVILENSSLENSGNLRGAMKQCFYIKLVKFNIFLKKIKCSNTSLQNIALLMH